uniref:Pulmonary surfactant-associated protein C n=1 Tax=Macrostomum lignano TaxID=282301 RepID=A0A1I8HG57_9PLAT
MARIRWRGRGEPPAARATAGMAGLAGRVLCRKAPLRVCVLMGTLVLLALIQ